MTTKSIDRLEELRSAAIAKQRSLMTTCEHEKRDLTASELAEVDERDSEITGLTESLHHEYELEQRAKAADAARGRIGPLIRTPRQTSGGYIDRETLPALERATRAMFDGFLEQRDISTGSAAGPFSSTLDWADCWPALAAKSITVASGIRTIDITETSVNLPFGTAYADAVWHAEIGTAVTADDGYDVSKITPVRVERLVTCSNDVLETTAFDSRRVITDAMLSSIGAQIDKCVFVGGVAPAPSGLINLTGHGSVTGGAVSDLSYFVEAQGTAFANNATVAAWAMSPASWTKLATVQVGGSADKRPLLSSDVNTPGAAVAGAILNHPIYVSTNFGTAACVVGFDPAEVYLVRRTVQNSFATSAGPALEMMIDPWTLMAQNQTRILIRSRVALFVPRPATVTVIATIS